MASMSLFASAQKFTLPAATNIEAIRYNSETYFKLGTTNRTLGGGGTNLNFFLPNGDAIPDASVNRYISGTTAVTISILYATDFALDFANPITRFDGAIYYRPVGSVPNPCK